MTEQACIVGARPDRVGLNERPEGTRVLNCEDCQAPTLFTPASLNRPEAARARFICIPCARKRASETGIAFEIPELSEAQLRECEAMGLGREIAQHMAKTRFFQAMIESEDDSATVDDDRPSDRDLEELAAVWNTLAEQNPIQELQVPAIALATLVTELLEWRAKAKAKAKAT